MVICDDYTRTNRPLGALYDDRNRGRGVAELTEITVNSVSATSATITNLTVSNILPIAGTVYVSGALQADSFIGLGGTGANSFPELSDVSPSYTPTPGNIIVIDSGGDLNSSTPSSFLNFVPNGGLAEDINSLVPTGGIDQYLWFNNTNPVLGTLGSTGNALLGAINAGAARSILNLGLLSLEDYINFESLGNTFDPADTEPGAVPVVNPTLNGLTWVPSSTFGGGGGATTLDDLTDVTITTPASNNILRYNGSTWVNSNVSNVLDATLNGLASLSGTSGTFIYFSGADTPALGIISDYSRDLLDETNLVGWQLKLGLGTFATRSSIDLFEVGGVADYTLFAPGSITVINGASTGITYVASNAIFSSTYQPLDATLTTIASFNPGANQYLYFSGTNQAALGTITSQGRSLLDDSTAAENRGTVGLSGATNTFLYYSGTNLPAFGPINAAGRDVLNMSLAQGDLIFYDGTNVGPFNIGVEQSLLRVKAGGTTLQWLDPGSNGDVLTIAGGELTWGVPSISFQDLTNTFSPDLAGVGDVLVVNGTQSGITYVPSSTFVGGGGSPGGSDTQVQFNDGGSSFGGDSTFTFDKDLNILKVPTASATTVSAGTLHLGGSDGNLINNNGKILINASNGVSCTGGFSSTTLTVGGISQTSKEVWTYLYLAADVSTTGTANANINDLRIPVVDNTYVEFEGKLFIRTASATVGPRPGLAFPTGATQVATRVESPNSNTAAALRFQGAISTQNNAATGLPTTVDTYLAILEGLVKLGSGTSGGITPTIASEAANNNVAVLVGSFVRYRTYTV